MRTAGKACRTTRLRDAWARIRERRWRGGAPRRASPSSWLCCCERRGCEEAGAHVVAWSASSPRLAQICVIDDGKLTHGDHVHPHPPGGGRTRPHRRHLQALREARLHARRAQDAASRTRPGAWPLQDQHLGARQGAAARDRRRPGRRRRVARAERRRRRPDDGGRRRAGERAAGHDSRRPRAVGGGAARRVRRRRGARGGALRAVVHRRRARRGARRRRRARRAAEARRRRRGGGGGEAVEAGGAGGGGRALLRDDGDQLRERRAAHGARVRGDHVGRRRALPQGVRPRGLLSHWRRRARPEDRRHGGGGGSRADRPRRQARGAVPGAEQEARRREHAVRSPPRNFSGAILAGALRRNSR